MKALIITLILNSCLLSACSAVKNGTLPCPYNAKALDKVQKKRKKAVNKYYRKLRHSK